MYKFFFRNSTDVGPTLMPDYTLRSFGKSIYSVHDALQHDLWNQKQIGQLHDTKYHILYKEKKNQKLDLNFKNHKLISSLKFAINLRLTMTRIFRCRSRCFTTTIENMILMDFTFINWFKPNLCL